LRVFWSRFLVALVLCFTLAAAGTGGAYWLANDKWDSIAIADIPDGVFADTEKGEPANFLIIGSDTRSFVASESERESFGTEEETGPPKSDTMMIAHVDPDTDTAMLVSFPRDLWVNIPGRGPSRINAAFNDGPAKVIETLETNFDVPIHHYLEVDFAGFQELVDAIGGVPIRFPTPARDEKTGLQILLPGCVTLNGRDALAYVRSRYYEYKETRDGEWIADPTSDLGRIRRQQYFIRSLAEVAINTAAKHPLKANNILNKAFDSLTKDRGLGLSDIKNLAAALRETDPAVVEMLTVPANPDEIGGASVLVLDDGKAAPIFERLRAFGDEGPAPTLPEGVVPGEVRVEVLNGSGVSGQAAATLDALAAAGFVRVDPPGNAERSDFETTQVRYTRGNGKKAQLVAAYLGVGEIVQEEVPPDADVSVVLGRDFENVTTPTTAPATTTTAKPTVTTGPPANPGQTPGAAPQPVVGC
jgi:LCP family protein required for cell wall assembly